MENFIVTVGGRTFLSYTRFRKCGKAEEVRRSRIIIANCVLVRRYVTSIKIHWLMINGMPR